MKKSPLKIFIICFLLISACVKTEDFDIPKVEIEAPDIVANSDISAIKHALDQSGEKIYSFDENDTAVIEGYVISSDEAGNFYKTLIIQDDFKDPVSGIEILIDLKAYFTKFNLGRKIFIKMAGLSVANNAGKYKIGYIINNKVVEIPESLIDKFIIRSSETESIVPKQISMDAFGIESINTFVEVQNVQFRNDEIGKTFAGEAFDEFNGERILVQCENQITSILSTSTFSDFRSQLISNKSGHISAVLTKDFYAEKYVLVLNNAESINFTDELRCDPEFLNCEATAAESSEIIYFENFQEIKKTQDLEALGWTNANRYLGNAKFKKRSSQENVSMQISAYNSNENPLEVWLISPAINLDAYSHRILTFDTKASYDNGMALTVWVSTDFNKNISEASWRQLDATISVGPGNTYVNDYISSGEIVLDCLEGNVFIAFKYLGGDPGIATTYDLDNIMIKGY